MEPLHGAMRRGRGRILQPRTSPRAARCRLLILAGFIALPISLAAGRELVADDLYRLQEITDPQFSPDGQWIAYTVATPDREADADQTDVWLASWDGKQAIRMTRSAASEHMPRWSPDGRQLAFLSDRADAKAGDQIWFLDRAGGEAQQRSHFESAITGYAWSPDGKRIVFTAEVPAAPEDNPEKPAPIVIDRLQFKSDDAGYLRNERSHLFLMDVATGTVTPLTDGPHDDLQPAWSPDGAQIAFAGSNHAIYLMLADGSGTRQLTTSTFAYPTPRWSPDGTKIAFLDAPNGYAAIFSINADGSGLQQLTDGRTDCYEPVWSPDSTKIAYQEDVVWAADIMVMNADGSDPRSLGGGNARPPIWSPDAHYVAFPLLDGNMGGLYAVSLDGAERLNVTRAAGWYYPVINPQWRE